MVETLNSVIEPLPANVTGPTSYPVRSLQRGSWHAALRGGRPPFREAGRQTRSANIFSHRAQEAGVSFRYESEAIHLKGPDMLACEHLHNDLLEVTLSNLISREAEELPLTEHYEPSTLTHKPFDYTMRKYYSHFIGAKTNFQTQLLSGRAEIQSQVCLTPGLQLLKIMTATALIRITGAPDKSADPCTHSQGF